MATSPDVPTINVYSPLTSNINSTSPQPATASRRKQAKPQPQRVEDENGSLTSSPGDQEVHSFFGAPAEEEDELASNANTDHLSSNQHHHLSAAERQTEDDGNAQSPTCLDNSNEIPTTNSSITHRPFQPPAVADLQGLSLEALRTKITELCSAMQLSYSVYNDLTHLLGANGSVAVPTVSSSAKVEQSASERDDVGSQDDENEEKPRVVNEIEASSSSKHNHRPVNSRGESAALANSSDSNDGGGEENGMPSDNGYRHRCPYCTKAFPGLSALTIHVRSHTGEKPYQCNYCLHRFTTKGNLKVHVQRHVEKCDQPLSPAQFDSTTFFATRSTGDHTNRCGSESPPPSSSGAPPPPPPPESLHEVATPLRSTVTNIIASSSSSLLTVLPHFAGSSRLSTLLPPQLSFPSHSSHWPLTPTLLTPASTSISTTNFMPTPTTCSSSFLPSPISPAFTAAAAAAAAAASSGILPPHVVAALFNSNFNAALASQYASSSLAMQTPTITSAQPSVMASPFATNGSTAIHQQSNAAAVTPFSPQVLSHFMWAAAAAAAAAQRTALSNGSASAVPLSTTTSSLVASAPNAAVVSSPALQHSRSSSLASTTNKSRTAEVENSSMKPVQKSEVAAIGHGPTPTSTIALPSTLPFSMFPSFGNSFRPPASLAAMFAPNNIPRVGTAPSSSMPFPANFPFSTAGGISPFPFARPLTTPISSSSTPLLYPSVNALPNQQSIGNFLPPFNTANFGAFTRPLPPPLPPHMLHMFAPSSSMPSDSPSSINIETNGNGKRYDPLLDPIVFTALLPQPGSNDNAWEQLMIVDESPESTRLLALMDTMLDKLSDPNQCIVCKRILSCKSALVMHYRTHTGERPFRCRLCSRAFTTKGNLKTHMGVHRVKLPLRPFIECPVCVRPFNDILILQQHIRAHAHMGQLGVPPPGQSSASSLPGDEDDDGGMSLEEQDDELAAARIIIDDEDVDRIKTNSLRLCENTTEIAVEEDTESIEIDEPVEAVTRGMKEPLKPFHVAPGEEKTRSHSNPLVICDDSPNYNEEVRRKRHLSNDDEESLEKPQKLRRSVSNDIHLDNKEEHAVEDTLIKVEHVDEKDIGAANADTVAKDTAVTLIKSNENAIPSPPSLVKATGENDSAPSDKKPADLPTKEAETQNSANSAFAGIEDLIKRTTTELGRSPLVASLMPFGLRLPSHSTTSLLNFPSNSAVMSASTQTQSSSAFDRPSLRSHYASTLPHNSTTSHWPLIPPHLQPPQQNNVYCGQNNENAFRHSNNHQPLITPELAALMQQKARNTTCNICFKTFACQSALQIHYRSHTKERPFKCPICSRGFTTKGNMKQHLLTHKIRDMPMNSHQHHSQTSTTSSSASPAPLISTSSTKDNATLPEFLHNPPRSLANFYPNVEAQNRLAAAMRQQQMTNPFPSLFHQQIRSNYLSSFGDFNKNEAFHQSAGSVNNGSDDAEVEVVDQRLQVDDVVNDDDRPASLPNRAPSDRNFVEQRECAASLSPQARESKPPTMTREIAYEGAQPFHKDRTAPASSEEKRERQRSENGINRSDTGFLSSFEATDKAQYRLELVCRKCPKSFDSKLELDAHMQSHASERPFMCPHKKCERAFTTKGNLKVHLATHESHPYRASSFQRFHQAPNQHTLAASTPRRQPLVPSTFLPPSFHNGSLTAAGTAEDCRIHHHFGDNRQLMPHFLPSYVDSDRKQEDDRAQHLPPSALVQTQPFPNPLLAAAAARSALLPVPAANGLNFSPSFGQPVAPVANLATANANAAAAAVAAVQTRAVFSNFMANLTNSSLLMQYAQFLTQMNNNRAQATTTVLTAFSASTSSPVPVVDDEHESKHADITNAEMVRRAAGHAVTCGEENENDDVDVDI